VGIQSLEMTASISEVNHDQTTQATTAPEKPAVHSTALLHSGGMMKQEIWKWYRGEIIVAMTKEEPGAHFNFMGAVASISDDGEGGYTWRTWDRPRIAGAQLEFVSNSCKTQDDAILAASKEVQSQLAKHGIECEIRRVKR
jgi:hypothetical protein